jgi:hypothetical protein
VGYTANAISPQRSVLTGQAFDYQPRSGLIQSFQQNGVAGTLGMGLTGMVRNAPGIGLISALGAPSRDWGTLGAQAFNTGASAAGLFVLTRGVVVVDSAESLSQLAQLRAINTSTLTKLEKGFLGESRGALTYQRAGYEELDARLPRNNGFDGVFVKRGPDGNPIDIIINESKFSSTGRASLANTNMGRQMGERWIGENIRKMMNSSDLSVMETGYLLDANRSLIRTKANVLDPMGNNRWNVLNLPR